MGYYTIWIFGYLKVICGSILSFCVQQHPPLDISMAGLGSQRVEEKELAGSLCCQFPIHILNHLTDFHKILYEHY
jgi:hypothetical protein